jgi:anti-sigma factor RsiW
MKQRADSEKLMIRYLLGDVPEDEQIRIEERFFTDDEYFEQLLALEDDLIDDYVNGELTDREREQFEEYFLASPARRQRVEFAKTFMRAGSLPALAEIAMPGEARPEPVPWWRNVMVFWRAQSLPRRFALAASVVLVLGGSWLIVNTMRLRNHVEQLQAERGESQRREQELLQHIAGLSQESERVTELSTQLKRERSERARLEQNFQQHIAEQRQRREELAELLERERSERVRLEQNFQQQIAEQRRQSEELAELLERERSERRRLEQQVVEQRRRNEELAQLLEREHRRPLVQSAPPRDSLAFALFPGRTRDIEGTNRFVIPQDVDSMQLRLYLPMPRALLLGAIREPAFRRYPEDRYTDYRAVIRTAEGNEVWSQDGLEAQRTGLREEAIVILDLPTPILPEGDYIITLSRRSASGDFEDVGSYQFSVVRK